MTAALVAAAVATAALGGGIAGRRLRVADGCLVDQRGRESSGHWGLFDGESSEPGGERIGRTTALSRVYARAVPGRVLEHAFDDATSRLRLRFAATAGGPLELFLPPRRFPNGAAIACDGAPVARVQVRDGVARLYCGRRGGEHVVEVAPR